MLFITKVAKIISKDSPMITEGRKKGSDWEGVRSSERGEMSGTSAVTLLPNAKEKIFLRSFSLSVLMSSMSRTQEEGI